MTPVATVSPAAIAATQGAAPTGAAPAGGIFAALFAAMAEGVAAEPAGSPGMPAGEGDTTAPTFVRSAPLLPVPEGGNPPPVTKNTEAMDDMTALIAPLPTPVAVLPAVADAPESVPDIATAQPPPTATAQKKGTAAPLPTPNMVGAETPPAMKGAVLPPVAASSPQGGEPIELTAPATAPADVPAAAIPPAQIAPQSKPVRTASPDAHSTLAPTKDDAAVEAETPQLQPATQAKKSTPGATEAKPAASDAKPAAVQTAPTGGNNSTIFVATASPDSAMPLPTADASAQVKTVPLSHLANLPNGAAVTAIGAVIASEAAAGTNRFIIRLDPPELGRVDVRLRFGRDGEVHARLIADRPETASLLMRDAATLERALNACGMRTDSGVDVMLRDSSSGFARNDNGFGSDAPAPPAYRPATTIDSLPDAPAWIRPAPAGRLDLTV